MAAKLKDKTDIDHHGPKYILIICHLPDPPTFSLPTTFKFQLFYCSGMQIADKALLESDTNYGSQQQHMKCRRRHIMRIP
jgi:hypothetical protein